MDMKLRVAGLLSLALASFGCYSTKYSYARTTQATAEARPATCQVDLFTTRPEGSFVELGVLENRYVPRSTANEFVEAVRSQVCEAGGDAVLAEVNGFGNYIRGTVIRFKQAEAAPATP
ncbi:hypothetical protein ACN469_26625 [Corallococcus terminator]